MGLRCLIGHDFGEIQTEHDRRDRGEEAIVTVREFRECARCGEKRVVSENKEVRSTATMDRAEPPEPAEAPDEPDAGPRGPTEEFDDVSAEEDDGVILEDEPERRQPGEWPEDETRESAEADDGEDESVPWPEADAEDEDAGGAGADDEAQAPWPEVEGEDEGYAAEPSEGGDLEGVEFNSGLTPEAAAADAGGGAAAEDAGDVVEATGGGSGSGGFRRASPGPTPTGRQRSDAAETEFYCPECGFTTPTEDSSLRPGDICPNCRLGYLTERES